MIVQCPSCASRYRIRDANIPPTGGKIRCPSCSHSFIVYPEAAGGEDEDRTSITSQGEISNLMNQMSGQRAPAPSAADEDYVATQIAGGQDLDKMRAMQALQNELGDPMDMDGTVEIKNPMEVWKEAQQALQGARGNAAPDESTDDYDHAATEVVNPNNLKLPFRDSGPKTIESPPVGEGQRPLGDQQSDPTFQLDRNAIASMDQQHAPRGDSSPGVDPSGRGSGVHPYAQNTPPSGQQPQRQGPPSRPGAQRAGSGSFDQPMSPPSRPGQSPSGLQADQLFGGEDLPETMADTPSAPDAGGAAPNPDHPGPWKLKTNFGLTYEFPDTRGLRSWLSNREELDGYTLSHDGENFFSLDRFPQLQRSSGRQPVASGNFSVPPSHGSGLNQTPSNIPSFEEREPSFDSAPPSQRQPSSPGRDPFQSGLNASRPAAGANPTAKGPVVSNDYRPPSRESNYKGLLWLVFLVLLLIAVAVGLQTFGVLDVVGTAKELMGQSQATQPQPTQQPAEQATGAAAAAAEVDPEKLAREQAAEVEVLIEDAERMIENNKLQSALEKLQTTEKIAPENPRIHEMLADVYERLGQADQSAKAEERAKELRAAEPDAEGEGEGEGEEPAEAKEPAESEKKTD